MAKLLLLTLVILSIPSGIAVGRLLWVRSSIYLETKRLELQEKRDEFSRKLLDN